MKKTDQTFSIGIVAKMTEIPKYKLRHWCDRHLTHIQRIQVGDNQSHRRFTEEDIKIIKQINQMMKEGHTLESAAKISLKKSKDD